MPFTLPLDRLPVTALSSIVPEMEPVAFALERLDDEAVPETVPLVFPVTFTSGIVPVILFVADTLIV